LAFTLVVDIPQASVGRDADVKYSTQVVFPCYHSQHQHFLRRWVSVGISYRYYRNQDAPALMHLWNQALQTRGCGLVPKPSALETHIFSKPWFDPRNVMLAFDEDTISNTLIGAAFAHFELATNPFDIKATHGTISLVMVHPRYRRQRIGSSLLNHVESYLAERHVSEIQAGSSPDRSPFLWGVVGGSAPTGVLQSDYGAEAFLLNHGYRPHERSVVLTRSLEKAVPMGDSRFPALRRRFSLRYHPRFITSWKEEAVEGSQEPIFFDLIETAVDRPIAQVRGWDMNLFSLRTKVAQAGLYGLHVNQEWRGLGLAKYLLCLVLQHLQEQLYGLVEAVVADENQKVRGLFERLGFSPSDKGCTYLKSIKEA